MILMELLLQFPCITIVQCALTGVDRGHQDLSDIQVSAKSRKSIKVIVNRWSPLVVVLLLLLFEVDST